MLYLTVKYPDGKTTYQNLQQTEIFIGRSNTATLVLDDRNVSNYHARLFFDKDMYWCEDGFQEQPSKNGTWVNGQRITEAVPVEKGDNILIGACQISISDMALPFHEATEEISFLKGKENLSPEDIRRIEMAKLDKKIRQQSWKIFATLALLLLCFLGIFIFLAGIPNRMPVQVVEVTRLPERATLVCSSIVYPGRNLVFESPASGTIAKVYKQQGDKVNEGDVLAEFQNGVALKSPLTGRIRDFSTSVNSDIVTGAAVCRIVDVSSVKIYGKIPETKIPDWQEQQTIPVSFQELPEQTFSATILSITFREEDGISLAEVIADIPNPQEQIQPGWIAYMMGMPPQVEGFQIPATCLVSQAGSLAVFVVEGNRCTLTKVGVAKRDITKIWVNTGLREHDRVILEPSKNLEPGQKVRIVKVHKG